MRTILHGAVLSVAMLASISATVALDVADPAVVERQYRLARRLGADGVPDAAAAFERVVDLAPQGTLADDALVDLARLHGSPDWPEDLGRLDAAHAALARVSLERVVGAYADGDRVLEARYRLALIRMAPLPGHDAAGARQDLISLASSPSLESWVGASRYALGFLDEQAGAEERAAGAYARVVVELPESEAAPRARAGFGRTLLAKESFGDAAGWFQNAIDSGAPPGVHAGAQRDLAIRELLRARVPARRWTALASPLAVIATKRGASLLATAADGRLVVFDRKTDTLQAFDADGVGAPPLKVEGVTALASDPYGRVYMATNEKLFRWDASGPTVVLVLTSFGAPAAIAVDASGAVYFADRKGDRVARWVPGTEAPVVVRESRGAGVAALVIAGGRVIAAEAKTGRIVALAGAGAEADFGMATFRRPAALAVDVAGRISVLDDKAGTVTRFTPSGQVSDSLLLGVSGVTRPVALAAAPDGAVRILDGSTGAIAVAP